MTALAATTSPASPQQRQIAATTLSSFKVVLTVTRESGSASAPMATVVATGYRHASGGWKVTASKRIGAANQWFWFPTEVCGLTVTELKPEPSAAATSDTMKVSLLVTPAIGCSKTYAESWRP